MSYTNETEPLLTPTRESGSADDGGQKQGRVKLFLALLGDSVPVILSYTLQNSIQTICILITGRLGPDELSAAAFSSMLAFVTGELSFHSLIVALGGTTALDTLGSQAYGSGRHADLSIHFQRCLAHLWALFIPVAALWFWMEPVLLALGQGERLSRDVQGFLRVLVVGAPGYIGFETLKKYLQCQGIMTLSTLVLVVVSPINAALTYILVHRTSLGLTGAPVALSITYWLMFLFLAVATWLSPSHKCNGTWRGLQLRAVLDRRSSVAFLKLALPGILMVGTEWTAFEIVALAAGRLGDIPLAAQSVIMTTDQILNTIPFGIGVAASARVGNFIGARSAAGAKYAGHASAFLSVIVGLIVMVIMLLCKNVYGYLFTDDVAVVKLVSKVMPLVASFQIADGLAGSCGGVLRGQGRQHLGALFNIVAYYVLALPLGITLAFKGGRGLEGLWVGQVIALFLVGIGEYGVVWLGTDWDREVARGEERNRMEAKLRDRNRVVEEAD
ncbi:MATE efflux family protein [Punctularia strigosozonata HHB-11173 SS5]|uniref:MATE efflux family protein n=1 Tax=Punctularia strigosozonata (strain HHB-11173) TaxID=741275 RepID=UPI0004417689|nr:MATE efflux family protein [Punctularia strigosozonata HHB-11173 SS5]EIN06499.1 MATE efflux family protein [Punctularia strigosozonata HHB-11173 SS5]